MKKKQPKTKHFEVYVPIYHLSIYIRLGGNVQEAYNYAAKKLDHYPPMEDEGRDSSGKFIAVSGKNDLCIWYKDMKPCISTIVHEVFPAVCYIYDVRGIWPLTSSNEEAFAYLIGDITRKITTKIMH